VRGNGVLPACAGVILPMGGFNSLADVLPACAGVILLRTCGHLLGGRAPRMCGGDPRCDKSKFGHWRCSPHVRG